jgi:hypothetical protein
MMATRKEAVVKSLILLDIDGLFAVDGGYLRESQCTIYGRVKKGDIFHEWYN